MPIFTVSGDQLLPVEYENFSLEKDLQNLIEGNLGTVFNCRLVATEFSTGALHAGRIDSLALSEENSPVIIEYKKVESSELINQSLFYLHWIQDHKGDFEIAAQKAFGSEVVVDWSDVRVICIAPSYKKYDLHAVRVMGANIELWKYRLFSNDTLYIEKIFHSTETTQSSEPVSAKNPVMVQAGKKAAIARANGSYTVEEHLDGKPKSVQALMHAVREFVAGLDPAIEEVPKKFYIAYKATQNIVCMEAKNKSVKLFLKLKPSDVLEPPATYRDVSRIGHYGTGDVEFTLTTKDDFEAVKQYIEQAYRKVGG